MVWMDVLARFGAADEITKKEMWAKTESVLAQGA
jgi:hypothetical protein